jgi:hypothetical protein
MVRFCQQQHRFYCGVDLHARTMYLCILDHAGQSLLHREFPAQANVFVDAIAPYPDGLVVAVECMFAWYWRADLCAEHGIPLVADSWPPPRLQNETHYPTGWRSRRPLGVVVARLNSDEMGLVWLRLGAMVAKDAGRLIMPPRLAHPRRHFGTLLDRC